MTHFEDVVGIDVSKETLDVCVLGHEEHRVVANATSGHRELIGWLKSLAVRRAVMEASGGYERAAARALERAGFEVRVVDPKRVRHFARAAGRLAKNDRIDARIIAEFGAVFAVAERCEIPSDAQREHLAGLVATRQAMMDHQTALQNQASVAPQGPARRLLAAMLKPIAATIKKLDRLIAAAIAEHPPFAALAARLNTVPGLGPVTTCKLRNILYMAVMGAATRHNPVLNAHYEALIGRGKLKKVAIIACMRKLLTILNAMVARDKDWEPGSASAITANAAA